MSSMVDGRYRIESALAEGGGGAVVYRATDVSLGRTVALKLMSPSWSADAARSANLQDEARALAAVRSPHVVQIHAFGRHEGACFLVMEFVQGRALDDLLRSHLEHGAAVPVHRALTILTRVAQGLAAVHAVGLVHRDVKPANIVIEEGTGRPVLVDFGLAVEANARGQHPAGTPGYLAPELLLGGPVKVLADVYALGCTAYELLVGRLPFEADDTHEMLRLHAEVPAPPLSTWRPELAAFDAVMARALAKAPSRRWDACLTFVSALAAAADPTRRSLPPPSGMPRAVAAPPRILVVDDDEDFRTFAARAADLAIPFHAADVVTAGSGPEALGAAAEAPPDLVLLDYDMPFLDGIDTLSRLRALPGGERMRVIVLSSAAGLLVSRWRFSILGVKDFILKPVGLTALVEAIASVGERAGLRDTG